jgi:anti-sigma regulatory factor (Ser/Thr protein kinase)
MPENVIIFPESFHPRDIKPIARSLENLVEFRGFDRVTLDFRFYSTCFPDSVLPLIALASKYQDDGVRFDYLPPRHERLARTFISSNWPHLLDPRHYHPNQDDRLGRFSARRFRDSAQQHELVNQILDEILRVTTFLNRNHLRALEWAINEITDNVIIHSKSSQGGVIQLTLKPNAKEIEFVVSDAGIGIPESLRTGMRNNWSDEKALEEAVKEGVTSGTGQGNGLFGSIQIAFHSGGAFSINSGAAYLALTRDGRTMVRRDELLWPGTSLDCCINYSKPLVLEQALRFADAPHTPVDLIDLKYEDEHGALIFSLQKEARSIGTRPAGFEARRKLENIVALADARRVVIDCSDLSVMSSSFADEFFAKLIEKFGAMEFSNLFVIARVNDTNMMIIDRSVRQRLDRSFIDILNIKRS